MILLRDFILQIYLRQLTLFSMIKDVVIFNKKYIFIITIALILFFFAISILVTLIKIKFNLLIILTIISFSVSIFLTIISLLKLKSEGRVLAITNLFALSVISIGGMFWAGVDDLRKFLFWLMILCISLYLIYRLNRVDVKLLFQNFKPEKKGTDN